MRVEVVFALPERQVLKTVQMPEGASVAEAIAESGVARQFPDVDFAPLQAGIWGKLVERDHVLTDGDRVEIYRPLEMDPREARRLKAGL